MHAPQQGPSGLGAPCHPPRPTLRIPLTPLSSHAEQPEILSPCQIDGTACLHVTFSPQDAEPSRRVARLRLVARPSVKLFGLAGSVDSDRSRRIALRPARPCCCPVQVRA